MTDTQAATAAVDPARRLISVWHLIVAVACLIAGYWLMAFATDRAWLYLPSIALQALAAGLAVWALAQGQRRWPWIATLVVAGVVALLTVIDLFFAALFSWGG
jgi:peptidoglycan/LPS O-acetylase OafA/YrhL